MVTGTPAFKHLSSLSVRGASIENELVAGTFRPVRRALYGAAPAKAGMRGSCASAVRYRSKTIRDNWVLYARSGEFDASYASLSEILQGFSGGTKSAINLRYESVSHRSYGIRG